MTFNQKSLLMLALGFILFPSIYIIYRLDINTLSKRLINAEHVATKVKSDMERFNKNIIILDNDSIKNEQKINSNKMDEILLILKKIEKKIK